MCSIRPKSVKKHRFCKTEEARDLVDYLIENGVGGIVTL